MPVDVFANHKNPSHHISLTDKDGRTIGIIAVNSAGDPDELAMQASPVDRTAMKTTQGNSKYSDFEPPYSPIPQDTLEGGRGQEDYEKDVTRFYDSFRMNTRRAGRAFLGPQETYGTGFRSQKEGLPGSVTWTALIDSKRYLARRFVSTTFTAGELWFPVAKRGTPNGVLTVKILADNAGAPGSDLATATLAVSSVSDLLSEFRIFTISQALVNLTAYWVEVIGASGDNSLNHWRVGTDTDNVADTKKSANGSSWSLADNELYYRVVDNSSSVKGFQFDYKGAKYCVTKPASGAPKLFINGDRGAADSNAGALTTLVDATKSWATDQWKDAIVLLTGGTGRDELIPYRTIVSNTTTTLTVTPAWVTTHDTTTEYVIIGANPWTEITGHGLTAPVTSVLVSSKGVIYFAQGDGVNIRRMREYNNSGTWTRDYADDGTNKAIHLIEGALKIWRGNNSDGSGNTTVSSANPELWGTSLTFGTPIQCGNNLSRIPGLEIYLDDDGTEALWVFKEDEVGFIKTNFISLQLREMSTVKSEKNGAAHLVFNTYLYWSFQNGLEQYYRPTLDDIGPNLDAGLPINRQGAIVSLIGYPGRVLAAIDAGSSGYSSILSYDGGGWHEEYRGPLGKSISALSFQVIPGTQPDRLWFLQGCDLVWIPFPSETTNPLSDPLYRYTHEGAVEFSAMTAGMADAMKFVKAVKVECDNLSSHSIFIEVDYKLDNESSWNSLTDVINTSPVQEIDLKSRWGLSAKRLQFRLRFQTNDNTVTPVWRMFLVEALTRVTNKFSYVIPFKFADNGHDLRGEPEDMPISQDKIDLINEWSTSTMVLMQSVDPDFDDKLVFVHPLSKRNIAVSEEEETGLRQRMGQITLQDA